MKIDPCSKGSWWQECVTGISEGPRLRTKMLGLLVQVLVWFDVAMWASSPVSWVTNVSGNKNSPFLGSDEIDNVIFLNVAATTLGIAYSLQSPSNTRKKKIVKKEEKHPTIGLSNCGLLPSAITSFFPFICSLKA
ncbi:hypothetical protein QQP08_013487 [Theobroma cacao]|nr:hypothetical protein QQP08_013487 [Theobroma cacao]